MAQRLGTPVLNDMSGELQKQVALSPQLFIGKQRLNASVLHHVGSRVMAQAGSASNHIRLPVELSGNCE